MDVAGRTKQEARVEDAGAAMAGFSSQRRKDTEKFVFVYLALAGKSKL